MSVAHGQERAHDVGAGILKQHREQMVQKCDIFKVLDVACLCTCKHKLRGTSPSLLCGLSCVQDRLEDFARKHKVLFSAYIYLHDFCLVLFRAR